MIRMKLKFLQQEDPQLYEAMKLEEARQYNKIELIASENYVSPAVLEAAGSILTNKYAEGYPYKRYYGGCEYVDLVEEIACSRAKHLFGADHANVQPHSGSQANMAVYFAMLKPGDRVLGMDLHHGGHLTHGSSVNFSGSFYRFFSYGVDIETGLINYESVYQQAVLTKPQMIVAGASAYSRPIDFAKFREIADAVGAYLLVDMAHIAGIVAAKLHMNPVPYADFVTTTTHKTLRGPRGGMILCRDLYAKAIDKAIFPGVQGGPLMHIIAAKAVALKECAAPSFNEYMQRVLSNASYLSELLTASGLQIISGGTDNHLLMIDLLKNNLTGQEAEKVLDLTGITVNKNTIPNDPRGPFITSGIRMGAAAITTRGVNKAEIAQIAKLLVAVINAPNDQLVLDEVKTKAKELISGFPLFSG